LTQRSFTTASSAALFVALLALSACTGPDEDAPAGLEMSSELDAIPGVESPIAEANSLLPESRTVGYSINGSQIAVVGIGENGCSVVAKDGDEEADSIYINLADVTVSGVHESRTIGRYAEAAMQVRGDGDDAIILKCGTDGIELCGNPVGPNAEIRGMKTTDREDCGLITN
jgi:hypothetical protein